MGALLTFVSLGVLATHEGKGAPHDPPQDESIATGDKQVLIARVDFPDATSSDNAWLDDSTVESWLGGSSDPSTQVHAYFKKASYGRLLLDKQTIVPGVTRLPEAITTYTNSRELYEGLRSALCDPDACSPYDPSSFHLIMIFWENPAPHFGYAGDGYSGTPVDIEIVKEGVHIQEHKNTEPMVLSINGMMHDGEACTQCKFGTIIHEMLHCLGAHYNADAWVPGEVDHLYPVVPAEAQPEDLHNWWEKCTGTNPSDPVSGCAIAAGDPYDPLGQPAHTVGSEPQAEVKWHLGWIQLGEFFIAEADHYSSGWGERVRLVAHDFGEESLAAIGGDCRGSDGEACKLALVAESATRRTDVVFSSVGKDWLWIEYKANYRNVIESDRATYSESEQQQLRKRGVILHLASGPGVGHDVKYGTDIITPLLLDADPSTTHGTVGDWPKGLADAPLQLGRSVHIKGHGLVVTVLGRSCNKHPPWLDIVVHRKSNCGSCWVEEEERDADQAPAISGIHHSPDKICAGQVAEFSCDAEDAETPSEFLGYEWDMGDGQGLWNTESSSTRDWAWYEPGTYNVTCTVWDGGAKHTTASISVVVAGETTDPSCSAYANAEPTTDFCREPETPAPTPRPTADPCRPTCISNAEPWETKCEWSSCSRCPSCSSNTNSDSDTTTTTTTDDIMLQASAHINGNGIFFLVLLLAFVRV
jgi:hypothetical protein